MQFDYRYAGASGVSNAPGRTGISLVPDASREPTFFTGELGHGVAFREAISALHDVVISDLRWRPKDRQEYQAWLAQQEQLDIIELAAQKQSAQQQLKQLQVDLNRVNRDITFSSTAFYKARKRYFDWLYKRDYNAWYVLDPVITVHPDQVFFECFSKDESSYGRLGVDYSEFENVGEFSCGTTNIDYSDELYDEFQKIRSYKTTRFEIEAGGFSVETTAEESYREVKIDLPDSWVRGFLQVSSAMTLPSYSFQLHPTDLWNFCFILRRQREKKGPRSIRYILEPGEPVRAIFEPWNREVRCARSIYQGTEAAEIRVWGRRRLHILERLIPLARSFTVHLLGRGLPSFYVADLGRMRFTLGLSGWTANDWSRMGHFDLMAPRAQVDAFTSKRVFEALKENWLASADELASRLSLDRAVVMGALSAWVQNGRAIYDIDKQVYRARELTRDPLPMDKLRFANPREQEANQLIDQRRVSRMRSYLDSGGRMHISGRVNTRRGSFTPEVIIDADERMISGSCGCRFFKQNRLHKGPCPHMLAVRLQHARTGQPLSRSGSPGTRP